MNDKFKVSYTQAYRKLVTHKLSQASQETV